MTAPARIVRLTHPDTGESQEYLLDEEDRLTPRGKKAPTKRFSSPYATLFDAGSELMMRDRRIRGTEHRVLHAILRLAPIAEREFPVQVPKLAAACLMGERRVADSLTVLERVGLIERPRVGWMRLNPRYVWRGGAVAREEALVEKIASAQGAEEELVWHMVEDGDLT